MPPPRLEAVQEMNSPSVTERVMSLLLFACRWMPPPVSPVPEIHLQEENEAIDVSMRGVVVNSQSVLQEESLFLDGIC